MEPEARCSSVALVSFSKEGSLLSRLQQQLSQTEAALAELEREEGIESEPVEPKAAGPLSLGWLAGAPGTRAQNKVATAQRGQGTSSFQGLVGQAWPVEPHSMVPRRLLRPLPLAARCVPRRACFQ